MKVALIHTRLLRRGGLETRLFSYIEYFLNRGDEVHVFVYKVDPGLKLPPGLIVHKLPIRLVPKLLRVIFFNQRLKRVIPAGNFDFVLSLGRNICQDALLIPGTHLGFLNAMGKKFRSISDRIQIEMDKKAYNSPGVMLAASGIMRDEVINLYHGNPNRVHILHPPIDTLRFHFGLKKQKGLFRKELGFSEGKFSAVFVSADHNRKGLPFLLEVFARLNPDQFELLVAGHQAIPGKLNHVRGLGFVKETEKLYAAADICLLPAKYEPFGQVIAESLLCGTPVIVGPNVGAKEIFEPDESLVLSIEDPSAWLMEIRKMAKNPLSVHLNSPLRKGLNLDSHINKMLKVTGLK